MRIGRKYKAIIVAVVGTFNATAFNGHDTAVSLLFLHERGKNIAHLGVQAKNRFALLEKASVVDFRIALLLKGFSLKILSVAMRR